MLFVVRRLQELGRARKIPLYMCFINLQKAYDSIDRELLWEVLARSGVPTKMLMVILNFHEGMRGRVRAYDGEHSEWFDVTQGQRQGCVMFSLPRRSTVVMVHLTFSEAPHLRSSIPRPETDLGKTNTPKPTKTLMA